MPDRVSSKVSAYVRNALPSNTYLTAVWEVAEEQPILMFEAVQQTSS